jgi:uncharacterized protein (TIGR00255 family)
MIRSMTGFARREQNGEFGTLVWEVRSVNHRYLEIALRVPEELRGHEGDLRATIQAALRRGKVDAVLQWRPGAARRPQLEVNDALLDALIARSHAVTERATAHGGSLTPPTPLDLLRWPGVLAEGTATDVDALQAAASVGLSAALQGLDAARVSEGGRISAMLAARASQIDQLVQAVRARLPDVRQRIRARLEERLTALTLPTEPNRERFEQELSLALSKMDIDEELDRLESHIAEVGKALDANEPAGRRLDFLMQEFNREANTLSSKSQDADTTRAAVEMKVLIEQMREQVQNIE